MEKDLRYKIREIIQESLSEQIEEQPTVDLSNVVSSELMHKKFLKIIFKNSLGNNLCLFVPITSFTSWYESNKPVGDVLQKYVTEFLSNPAVEDEQKINEIVNEFGDIIGDEDMGNNSTNTMVGKSKFGTDKAIRQTVPKIKTYDAALGNGILTW